MFINNANRLKTVNSFVEKLVKIKEFSVDCERLSLSLQEQITCHGVDEIL